MVSMVLLPGVGSQAAQGAARTAARARVRGGDRFADRLRDADQADDAAEARPTAQVSGPSAIFLALQDEAPRPDRPEERDARARREAEATLDDLATLQRGLLAGRIDRAGLEALAARLDAATEAADPGLALLVGQVILRAKVELARLDTLPARIGVPAKSP